MSKSKYVNTTYVNYKLTIIGCCRKRNFTPLHSSVAIKEAGPQFFDRLKIYSYCNCNSKKSNESLPRKNVFGMSSRSTACSQIFRKFSEIVANYCRTETDIRKKLGHIFMHQKLCRSKLFSANF